MKNLLFSILLFILPAQAAEDLFQNNPLSGTQQAEEILHKCKSPRWKIYDNAPTFRNDYYLKDILQEEIACKEEAFIETLNTIVPDPENRIAVIQAFHAFKKQFLNLYGLIAQKNLLCDETWPACGSVGDITNVTSYDTALTNLIIFTLERQDWKY